MVFEFICLFFFFACIPSCFLVLLDVFSVGPFWSASIPESPIAEQLKANMKFTMVCSRAEGTNQLYLGSFNRWKKFARDVLLLRSFLPADPLHVALFLQYLVETCKCASSINSAFYSLNWAHRLSGLPSPTDNPFVISVRDGAIRLLSRGKESNRKEPLELEFLQRVSTQSNLENLVELRNVVMFVLSFAGFLRSSEVLELRRGDVEFSEGFVSLTIGKSKTDQLRDGHSVVLSEVKDCTVCPVKMLQRYLEKANINLRTNEYLFRPICVSRKGQRLVSVDRPISYSTYREAFKKAFGKIVPDISKFSTHSLRSGGATLAANSGIPDRQFQRHGRWKSTKAKDMYVKDSLSSRLSVSSTLGCGLDSSTG